MLNCENFHFTEYTRGTEIIMQDAYTIGNNLTFSTEWGTPCTEDYGDCGCDNCHLGFEDIAVRMDEYKERIRINGWELEKAVWAVPQAFGGERSVFLSMPALCTKFVVVIGSVPQLGKNSLYKAYWPSIMAGWESFHGLIQPQQISKRLRQHWRFRYPGLTLTFLV